MELTVFPAFSKLIHMVYKIYKRTTLLVNCRHHVSYAQYKIEQFNNNYYKDWRQENQVYISSLFLKNIRRVFSS